MASLLHTLFAQLTNSLSTMDFRTSTLFAEGEHNPNAVLIVLRAGRWLVRSKMPHLRQCCRHKCHSQNGKCFEDTSTPKDSQAADVELLE